MKYLFVGGSVDGQWMEATPRNIRMRVPLPTPAPSLKELMEPKAELRGIKTEDYLLRKFYHVNRDGAKSVYVHELMRQEDALKRVEECYNAL